MVNAQTSSASAELLPFRRQRPETGRVLAGIGEIGVEYQPQFDLATGRIRGIEALMRATDPRGRILDAAEIVAAAEDEGSIHTLGAAVMRKACADFAAMRAVGCRLGRLAINVSPMELKQKNYAAAVVDAVLSAGLQFNEVELEITENCSLSDPGLHIDQLATLSSLGIAIALDDFGSAHANWVNALRLPIQTLKIDRALITHIARCRKSLGIVRSICQACADIGLEIVAEGVCNAEQRRLLLDMRCNNGQGFGLGVPMTAARAMDIKPQTFDCLSGRAALSKTS